MPVGSKLFILSASTQAALTMVDIEIQEGHTLDACSQESRYETQISFQKAYMLHECATRSRKPYFTCCRSGQADTARQPCATCFLHGGGHLQHILQSCRHRSNAVHWLACMSVGVHSVCCSNGQVVEQAEAVAANRVPLAGHLARGACVVPRGAHSTENVPSLQGDSGN